MQLSNIDHSSPIPLHLQVEAIMRELIDRDEYQQGKLFPNEIDLAKRFGIARNTVRQAINTLVNEQLLIRKKGVGTKVAKKRITTKLNNWSSFSLEMHDKGVDFRNYEIKASWSLADQDIADVFGIALGSRVVKLERLRGLDAGPIVYFVSYFHPRVGLTGTEDFSRPLYEMLEKEYHTVVVLSKEEITATLADTHLATILHTNPGEPILLRRRIVCDPGERVVEFNIGYYRADRFTYAIDIARK
ncbi:GntR family transcriptional regulator [Spirosoma luteolum]